MDTKGTTRAVGSLLIGKTFSKEEESRAEQLAQKRYLAKLEEPDNNSAKDLRRNNAWDLWLLSDTSLRDGHVVLGPHWAQAKLFIAEVLKDFRLGPVSFTNGSEFIATHGFNSIESKLKRSVWTCTFDNFSLWVGTVYQHRGLKFAMRKRLNLHLATRGIDKRKLDRWLWKKYRNYDNFRYRIFEYKLAMITEFVQGNRFSTVPKNNIKDRPICIEPLANILVQRRVGSGIRSALQRIGVDLDVTADKHRHMISSAKYATIDLKDASDRIALKLCRYLLPRRVFSYIEQSRSAMTLGLDDSFYVINKVSSMGNGFTFELMSLILLALSRSFTDNTSVFGDDIIVPNEYAEQMVENLEIGGFVINREKTHIYDTYRESCGAHYFDESGYAKSFDFHYPRNMADVITTLNKLSYLAMEYPSFRSLFQEVYKIVPRTLYASNTSKVDGLWERSYERFSLPRVDTSTVVSSLQFLNDGLPVKASLKKRIRAFCKSIYENPTGASLHYGFEWIDAGTRPRTVHPKHNWAKILMYLASGRICGDTRLGVGAFKSFLVVTLQNGRTFRLADIVIATK